MSFPLSKADAIKEFKRCGKDPIYFINNYCKLSHPQRGIIPFKTWDFQQELIQKFCNYQHNIILKSRQLGISRISAAYAAWLMLFHREKSIMVASIRQKTAVNLLKHVKFMIKNLPPWFKQFSNILFDNKTSFTLTNGSEIIAASKATDVGRSESLSLLIIDEAAHVSDMDEAWTAAGPTMAAGGRSIVLSTPSGVSNWFYKKYIEAEKGDNEFHPTKLLWNVHPERDEEWEIAERKKFNAKQFAQEYEASFLSSGNTVIESKDLERVHQMLKKPILRTGFDKNIHIWEYHDPKKQYFLIADTARGDGEDFSAFHVFELGLMDQVAEYKAKIGIELYAKVLFDIGKEYGTCMIVVENNFLGYEVCQKLIKMGYENIYYEEKGTREYIAPWEANIVENVLPGFATSPKNRLLMINRLEESIRRGLVNINSERTYSELENFIWNNHKPEAAKGKNDDLVMPLAIACWVRETAIKQNLRTLQYKKTFLNAMMVTRSQLNTTIPGMIGYSKKTSAFKRQAQEQHKQYGWVTRG